MGIFKRQTQTAALSANGVTVRAGDRVSWRDRYLPEIRTGRVLAVTTTEAKVALDERTIRPTEVLPFSRLTVDHRGRDDDKTAALVAVYQALREHADRDLGIFTFLTNDWPQLVPEELRALLDIGPDSEAENEHRA